MKRLYVLMINLLLMVSHVGIGRDRYVRKRILHKGYEIYCQCFCTYGNGIDIDTEFTNEHIMYLNTYEDLNNELIDNYGGDLTYYIKGDK